jgi:hypothetical protein
MYNIMWLNFGKNGMDLNLCSSNPAGYQWDATPDLSNSTSTGKLVSNLGSTPANSSLYPNLTIEMAFLDSGALNIYWTYENDSQSGYSTPFEVPNDVVNTKRNMSRSGAVLSDYITLGTGASGSPLLSVKNGDTVIYDLEAVVLKEHFNFISAKAHVDSTNFKGIMGLAERTVSDLFLPEGIYALWSRDAANPVEDGKLPGKNMYGVHPFYMAKDKAGKWFGVYTNLAAAQDWKVKYDT